MCAKTQNSRKGGGPVMRALITGASSGLGELFALQLSEMGYDIVVTARREDKLEQLTKKQKPM